MAPHPLILRKLQTISTDSLHKLVKIFYLQSLPFKNNPRTLFIMTMFSQILILYHT